jgi:hypothetical protein
MPAMPGSYEYERAPYDDGPEPMAWSTYERNAQTELAELIDADPSEPTVQRFLEENPPFVPGVSPFITGGGHGPWLDAVITQPPLQGLGKRVPDFMWIMRDSAFLIPVLVEIEAPGKPWFVGGDNPRSSAALTQALNQFRQWREWFAASGNLQVFFDTYAIPQSFRRRKFKPLYVLVFGRRRPDPQTVGRLRADLQRDDQFLVSYDHLRGTADASRCLSVRNDGSGGFTAVAMPPTATFSPHEPYWWRLISGREEAVRSCRGISEDRRAFLLERLAALDAWSERERVRLGDTDPADL